MSIGLVNLFSLRKESAPTNGRASFMQSRTYNEKAFQFLLGSEAKRSERSGYVCQILLVSRTDITGNAIKMNDDMAQTIMSSLSQCLRETDYVGWYREGFVAGGVLTVIGPDASPGLFQHIQARLTALLRFELGEEVAGQFRIRLCQCQELGEEVSFLGSVRQPVGRV